MGFFSSANIFKNREQVKKALFAIGSLDQRQREIVYQALVKELDNNGITVEELKEAVRKMRAGGMISEIDKENLLKLIQEK